MNIRIASDEGLPIYQQIVNQVTYLVSSEKLQPGEELPPIRVLAEQLLINPNTVARAYRELQTAGIVEKRGTTGTYVSSAPSPLTKRERLKIIHGQVDSLLAAAKQLGIEYIELTEIIDKRNSRMTDQTDTGAKSR